MKDKERINFLKSKISDIYYKYGYEIDPTLNEEMTNKFELIDICKLYNLYEELIELERKNENQYKQ